MKFLYDNSTQTNWKHLTIVAVVGLLASGGILLLKATQPLPSEVGPTVQQRSSPSVPMPSFQPLDTSDWQTYRNSKYQFEIRYPKEFEVSIAGPIKYSPDRLNFRTIDICEKWWVNAWGGDYGHVLKQTGKNYSRSDVVIGGREVIVHLYNFPSAAGYSYEYEVKKDNCTSLIFTFGSSVLDQATDTSKPTTEQKKLFDQILATLRFVGKEEAASWTDCVDMEGGVPVITSVSPDSGPVGTEIEIRGCNFSGFEGDLNAWIENKDGVSGIVYGQEGSTSKLIRTTLGSNYCQTDNSYSGLPCEKWLTLTPGTYKIYVVPWGQGSNAVSFTITQ